MDELEQRTTADGSVTLYSRRFAQTFHSRHGAFSEASHVFLEGSGMGALLRSGRRARILEVGFGTGLNYLISASAALQGEAELDYLALERTLLPAEQIARLGYERYARRPLTELLAFRRSLGEEPIPGEYRTRFASVGLTLYLAEAQACSIEAGAFDAIYHDAFSPDANPELWTATFLGRLARSLKPGARLVSYTVKGEVRRRLADLGLLVSKATGPAGGKREMLLALRPEAP